jgi:hypothetical protein
MDNDSDLIDERQTVVRRLLDAYFGRSSRSEEGARQDIRRIGAINRRLKGNDETPSQAPVSASLGQANEARRVINRGVRTIAISCRPKDLSIKSNPLDKDAERKLRSPSRGKGDRMVARSRPRLSLSG